MKNMDFLYTEFRKEDFHVRDLVDPIKKHIPCITASDKDWTA